MKKADASGARFAVIIGDDEARAGRVAVKPLREPGEQLSVTVEDGDRIDQPGRAAHSRLMISRQNGNICTI